MEFYCLMQTIEFRRRSMPFESLKLPAGSPLGSIQMALVSHLLGKIQVVA